MKVEIQEARLIVISDLHIGHPIFRYPAQLEQIFDYACENGYSMCINGDGLEFEQSSIRALVDGASLFYSKVRQMAEKGLRVYYVIGNHDILLENFLDGVNLLSLVPFLNLTSGRKRIRIEHGHLYDPAYADFPRLYHIMTVFAGWLLKLYPKFYYLWIIYKSRSVRREGKKSRQQNKPRKIFNTIAEVGQRGFDAVVVGHTHIPGEMDLGDGIRCFNTGTWLGLPHYVIITDGDISLNKWGS